MGPQSFFGFLSMVGELIDLARETRDVKTEQDDDSETENPDPVAGMLFQQAGPNRSFPRLDARRVNLAKDTNSARLAKMGKIPRHDGN